MNNKLGGLRKVCFYDPATGDRVVVSRISSATTSTPQEKITSETPTGVTSGGDSYVYDIGFFDADPALLGQLEEWESDETPIRAVLLYENNVRFWNESKTINGFVDSQQMNARDGVSPFIVSLQSIQYDPDIYMGVNMLWAGIRRNKNNRTQFADADYIPKRNTVAGAEQWRINPFRMVTAAGSDNAGGIDIPFPFPGEVVYWGGDRVDSSETLTLRAISHAMATITASTASPGAAATAFTTPAGIFALRFRYIAQNADDRVENPYIRLTPGEYTDE